MYLSFVSLGFLTANGNHNCYYIFGCFCQLNEVTHLILSTTVINNQDLMYWVFILDQALPKL